MHFFFEGPKVSKGKRLETVGDRTLKITKSQELVKFDITSSPSTHITWCFSCTRSNNKDQVYYWLKKIWNNRLSPYKTCWEYLGVAISHLAIFLKIKSFFLPFLFLKDEQASAGQGCRGLRKAPNWYNPELPRTNPDCLHTTPDCFRATTPDSVQPRTAPYYIAWRGGQVFFCWPPTSIYYHIYIYIYIYVCDPFPPPGCRFLQICGDLQGYPEMVIPGDPKRPPQKSIANEGILYMT